MVAGDGTDEDDEYINVRNQASISLAGNLADAAISFGGLVLFANVLGADGLGKFYVLLAVIKVLLFPVKGVGQAVMKRGSERGLEPNEFFGGGLVYGGGYVLLVGVTVATVFAVDADLLGYDPLIVGAAFAVFGTRMVFLLLIDAYRGHGRTGFATLTDNVLGVLETFLQAVLVVLGAGVLGLLSGTAVATVLVSAALLVVSEVGIDRPDGGTIRSIWSFARWSVVTSGTSTVYDRLPVLVIGFVVGNAAAGYFTSAMRLLILGSYVGGSIAPALMVRASSSDEATRERRDLSDLELSLRYASVLAIPLMFGSFAIPDALMRTIFGPTFAGTGPILVGLAVFHFFNPYETVTFSYFDGIDRPDYGLKATAVALGVRVVAIAGLVVEFGTIGVVVAVVATHALKVGIGQFLFVREFERPVLPAGIGYQLASGGLMWVVVTLVAGRVRITSWIRLLVIVGLGGVCYVSLLLATDAQFRQMVRAVLREVWTKTATSTR